MERRQLLSTYVVQNSSDDPNPGSLRWAIVHVNSDTGLDTIQFDLPGEGPQTIRLGSPLPAIFNSVVMDGTTQPGYQGAPLVEIDGSGLSSASGSAGLVLTAGGSRVAGLSLVGFPGAAIVLQAGGHNVIEGNYLGVAPAGTVAIPNGQGLSLLGSSANTIGSGAGGLGNVISGNAGNGLLIQPGDTASAGNVVTGNRIGTTADGTAALGNQQSGITIVDSPGNLIGLTGQAAGNLVSGNLGPGIILSDGTTATQILGNQIGLASDGRTPLGNGGDGIWLDDAPANLIGDGQPGDGNVIVANRGSGIRTSGTTDGLLVEGNSIGTDPTGTLQLGNLGSGLTLGSSANTIGGASSSAANLIDFNGSGLVGAGVQLVGNVNRNAILSNSIYANAGLGINLGNGVTPNHAPGTPGPNDYQNYPVLSLVQSDGQQTTVQGTLFESPNTTYLLQFFSSPTADPSGHGQGQLLIGTTHVTTDSTGQASFTVSSPGATTAGLSISATATSPTGDTSEFSADTVVPGVINLELAAAGTPNPVPAGDNVTYSLTVTNAGNIAAHNVVLTDQLPPGLRALSTATSQGFILPMQGGAVTVMLGTIAAGASASVTIVVPTAASSVPSITDTATVTSQEPDPYPGNESKSVTTTVRAATDLAIALNEDPNPALAGGDLTYTMTVSNNGPMDAGDVVATLPVASGAAWVPALSTPGMILNSSGQVVARIGKLAMGGQATVTVVLQALAVGNLTETATVSSDDVADPKPSNNTATVITEVDPAADLAVHLAASSSPAATGQPFSYDVTVTNAGPVDATEVVVSDTLPGGVSFVSASTDQGVQPMMANGVVTATFATLAAGASATLTILVDPTAAPGSTLNDSAAVAGQQADPNPSNNQASLATPVRGVSDLGVTASAQPGSLHVGQGLTYTITVTNQGPNDEPDAVLTSALPAGLTIASGGMSSTQGTPPTITQGILTADLGPLRTSAKAVVTLVGTPGPTAVGTLSTSFTVSGQDLDLDSKNNTAEAAVSVDPSADLAVGISPGGSSAFAQVGWTYTLVVSNAGPSDATGVTASSRLPANVAFISATSSQGGAATEQDGVISARLGTIAAGKAATVTVVVLPTPAAATAGSIGLSATVAGDEFDPEPGNNQASLTVPVAPSVSLAMSLVATPPTVPSGQTLSFTATVSNTGSTPATSVVLTLPLAASLLCNSWTASQGTAALVNGQLSADLGALNPGSSATMTVFATAMTPGTVTQSGMVTASQYNLDPQGASASATAQVLESPGIVQFAVGTVSVSEMAGLAQIPVVRLYGALGAISVQYRTVADNATPGLDYVPVSGTLVFGPGQTSGTITVPVRANPYDKHDESLDIVLDSPTGGAILGGMTTAVLRIQDVDPDTTPPQVTGLTLTGSSRSITSLTLSFTGPLDPSSASNPANYRLVSLVGGGVIPIASIRYNSVMNSVTVVPSWPLPSRQYDQIQVIGAGPTGLRDLAGNLLDGAGTGTPGSDYVASFAQGTRLQYVDNTGNRVTLQVKGRGYLQQVRDSAGEGILLNVVGMVPHRTTLTGGVKARKGRGGQTDLGLIQGLGQFGDVRVLLKTPPFRVRQFPFQRRGRAVL